MAVSSLLLLDHIRYDDIEDLSMWTTLLSVFHQYAHETAQLTQAIVNAGVDFAEYEYMPHNRQWYHNWHAQGSEAGDATYAVSFMFQVRVVAQIGSCIHSSNCPSCWVVMCGLGPQA